MAYTCNYIDGSSGKLKTKILESAPFGCESHTGENIEDKLKETVESWHIAGIL